jgi:hypothetical protein
MNISKHAYRRYAQRYKTNDTGMELEQYVSRNKERLTEEINTMLDYAELVFVGQLRGNTTRKYYYQAGSIIITDVNNSSVITIYKISYGFTPEIDMQIAKGLVEEIKVKEEEVEKHKHEIEPLLESLNASKEGLENDIERLEKQLKDKKEQFNYVDNTISGYEEDVSASEEEAHELTNKLVGSKDFQEDLAQITGTNK